MVCNILYCSAYGESGTDPNSIKRGPIFLSHPNGVVVAGRNPTAEIECEATGYPPPNFQWYRNFGNNNTMQEVTSLTDSRYTLTNGKLTIEDPEVSRDMGDYQCSAENSVGKIISDPVQLSFGCKYR